MKKKTEKRGRKRIGQPISITVTDDQRAWLEAQVPEGGALTEVVRRIITEAMADMENEA